MSNQENSQNPGNNSSDSDIKVVCRFRPQNEKELALKEGGKVNYDFSPDGMSVYVKTDSQKFTFDRVFEMKTTQEEVYTYAAKPVILQVIEGYNGTIFAYGQTSAGKTHTMEGPDYNDKEKRGIIPRMIDTLFETIYSANQNIEFTVQVSMLEIYNEKIRDLLDPTRLDLKVHESRDKGVYVGNASDYYVSSPDDIFNLLKIGTTNRSVGATNMNKFSSRSHSIFVITIAQRNLETLSRKSGRLYLVDLAGSEKIQKTGAEGTRLDEAKNINKSLFTLGSVINALTDGKSSHVPYRDSQLTRILQEALGGNSKTALILNCSPAKYNEEETVSTLRFGIRAKRIKNKAVINAEKSAAELKMELAAALKEIELLKRQLLSEGKEIGDIKSVVNSDIDEDEYEKLKQRCEAALDDVDELQKQVDERTEECNNYDEIVKEFRNVFVVQIEEIEIIQQCYRDNIEKISNENDYLKEKNKELKGIVIKMKDKHPEEVKIELSDNECSDSEKSEDDMNDESENDKVSEDDKTVNDEKTLQLNNRIEELESEMLKLNKEMNEVKEKNDKLENENEGLKNKLKKYENDLDSIKKEKEGLENDINEKEKEIYKMKEELSKEKENGNENMNKMKKEIDIKTKEICELKELKEEKEKMINEKDIKMEKLENIIKNKEEEMKELENQKSELSQNLSKEKGITNKLQSEMNRIWKSLVMDESNNNDTSSDSLLSTSDDINTSSVSKTLSFDEEDSSRRESEISENTESPTHSKQLKIKMKLSEMKKQIKDYEIQINNLTEGLSTYQVDYDTLKIEHEEMKKKYEEMLESLTSERDLNSQLENQISKIGEALHSKSVNTDNPVESLQQMTELCRAQETMILKLKDEIEQYKSIKEELLSETSSLKLQLLVDSDNSFAGTYDNSINNNGNNNNNNNRNRVDSTMNENMIEQYNEITNEYKQLSSNFEANKERLNESEERIRQLEERNEALTNLLKRREENPENFNSENDLNEEYAEAYLSLMNDVVLREQQIQTLQDSLHNRCDRVVQLELQLDACKEQIELFDQAYMKQSNEKKMRDENRKLEMKLKEKDAQLSKMMMTLHLNEKKMTSLNDKIKELEKKTNSGSVGYQYPSSASTIRGGATINAIKGRGAAAAGFTSQVVPIRGGLKTKINYK